MSVDERRKAPIKRRDGGRRFGSLAASRAGSHQRLRTASRVQDAFPSVRREGRSQTEVALHLRFLFYWRSGAHHDERILPLVPSHSGMDETFFAFGEVVEVNRSDIHWAKIYPPVISPERSSRDSAARVRYRRQWRPPRCSRDDLSQNPRLSRIIAPSCSPGDRLSSDALERLLVSFESSAVVIGPGHESHAGFSRSM